MKWKEDHGKVKQGKYILQENKTLGPEGKEYDPRKVRGLDGSHELQVNSNRGPKEGEGGIKTSKRLWK